MALGTVNVPSVSGHELDDIRAVANTAKEVASAAQNTADGAKSTAEAALAAANSAQQTAGTAKSTADEALETANGAADSLAAAQEAATAAETAAQQAKAKAEQAATAAQNAQTAADSALQAVTKLTNSINAIPSQNGSLTYTGSQQSPAWNSFDSEKLTIGGQTFGTEVGTYTATFTPKEGFNWSDGSTEPVSVNWTISRARSSYLQRERPKPHIQRL